MRSMLIASFAVLAVSPGTALATKFKLDLVASGDQKSRMNSGVEVVDSDLPESSVRIFESEDRVSKRGILTVFVMNASKGPINFGSENVTVETDTVVQIAVIPYERLLKEEENRQMWAAIAVGLSAVSNSLNASLAGNSYGTVNAYGSGGWASATYSAYNPAAASVATSLATMQNQQLFDRLADHKAVGIQALEVNLRTTTVDLGHDFGGMVTYELPKKLRARKTAIPVRVHVRLGNDVHIFHANFVPAK